VVVVREGLCLSLCSCLPAVPLWLSGDASWCVKLDLLSDWSRLDIQPFLGLGGGDETGLEVMLHGVKGFSLFVLHLLLKRVASFSVCMSHLKMRSCRHHPHILLPILAKDLGREWSPSPSPHPAALTISQTVPRGTIALCQAP